MAYTSSSITNLSGRTAVVTGANGGIGFEIARGLVGAGAHVVMAARDQTKAQAAVDEIRTERADASVEVVELDLASLASIRAAADVIGATHDAVDVLVNNAGLMALPERATTDGFEMQFGVNHLGHWALTAHLMPALLRADAARVVTQTSVARHFARRLDPDNPHLRGRYHAWTAYNRSKLANYHFALGLQQRFERAGVRTISLMAHPGLTNSDLQSHTHAEGGAGILGSLSARGAASIGMSTPDGALPALRAATDPRARGGTLYAPRFGTAGAAVRRPVLRPGAAAAIATLWDVSERETGISLDIPAV